MPYDHPSYGGPTGPGMSPTMAKGMGSMEQASNSRLPKKGKPGRMTRKKKRSRRTQRVSPAKPSMAKKPMAKKPLMTPYMNPEMSPASGTRPMKY